MDWKKIIRKLLFPHPAVLWITGLSSAVLLPYSFIAAQTTDVLSIASYVLSFYALVIICLRVPDIIRFVIRFKTENKYAVLYSSDMRLRMNISLYGSFSFNAVYSVFQLGLGIYHASVWYYAMALYYLLLAVMRLLLARHTTLHIPGEQQTAEWKKYRFCAVCLLIMNLVLTIIVAYFVGRIRIFRHHEITTIAMAAFTFTSLTMAIVNVVRFRNSTSPAYAAVRAISLVTSIVSMLTLENAMLTAFGQDNSLIFHQIMLGMTGLVVILLLNGIAIHMIMTARNHLKKQSI